MFDLSTLTPYKQAGIILALGLIFMLGNKFFQAIGVSDPNPEKIWIMAATFGLFFSVANCIFSLNVKEGAEKYWMQSMLVFIVTMAVLAGMAFLISGMDIRQTGSFQWIFLVVIISYFVFSTIIRMMKGIVDFAQREEWNQPKSRK